MMNAPRNDISATTTSDSAKQRQNLVDPRRASSGQALWRFDVLPKIPLKLVFYEADDDFPAEFKSCWIKQPSILGI